MAAYIWKEKILHEKRGAFLFWKKGREIEERKVDSLEQIEFERLIRI